MTTHSAKHSPKRSPSEAATASTEAAHAAWQAQNLEAIHARLQPLRPLQDGAILVQASGIHFQVVLKEGSSIRFMLVEQINPDTGVVQSEIDIDQPLLLMEPYTQALLAGLAWQPNPERVYMAGLGGGRVPLLLHHYLPATKIDCTDIDPAIVEIAETYFGIAQDERLHFAIEDGRRWLEDNPILYDLILLDVFLDNGYTPYRMTTLEFFRLCSSRLAKGGVVAINLLSTDPYIAAKARTLGEAFPYVYSFTEPEENIILYGSNELVDIDVLHGRAAKLDAIHAFPFLFCEIGARIVVGAGEIDTTADSALLLTDTNPPADYFDALPSFNTTYSQVAPELPCPCGSGLAYADCHGAAGRDTENQS